MAVLELEEDSMLAYRAGLDITETLNPTINKEPKLIIKSELRQMPNRDHS